MFANVQLEETVQNESIIYHPRCISFLSEDPIHMSSILSPIRSIDEGRGTISKLHYMQFSLDTATQPHTKPLCDNKTLSRFFKCPMLHHVIHCIVCTPSLARITSCFFFLGNRNIALHQLNKCQILFNIFTSSTPAQKEKHLLHPTSPLVLFPAL